MLLRFGFKTWSGSRLSLVSAITLAFCFGTVSFAQTTDGVVARCGASKGHGYFFQDALMNPEGPSWEEDGISSGKIILVRLGDEWDIQFDDAIGATGYRNDGARVIPLMQTEDKITVGAFNELYADIYTFDIVGKKVAWSSNKLGPISAKVAVYVSDCE